MLLVCISALSPAWSQRLLPLGAYDEVPDYWHEATDYINEHADNTRTLIYPEASFARQEWGWTRDEPAQPLLDVPWAVRHAIPLVPPEAIRGLDGVMAALDEDPASGVRALQRLGIGAVMVVGVAVAAPLVPMIVGDAYAPVAGLLWAFAALGVTLSVLQAFLLSTIATDRTVEAGIAWCGLLLAMVVVWAVPREVAAVLGATLAMVVLTTSVAGWRALRPRPA